MAANADIGLIGLAVMGENLVLNMADKGFAVTVYNRTTEKVDAFLAGRGGAGRNITGAHTVEELVSALKRPRRVMLMVRAGKAVDDLIAKLLPLLDTGDIVIDGGNSFYGDTGRRLALVESHGMHYIGLGVSGGEEGALRGPSLMPGGSIAAWESVKPILQTIAAKVNGEPCCDWVGGSGAGHFVKMVHNGIEYGDMQIIGEAYALMRELAGLSAEEMSEVFARWNEGDLSSYLVEITRDILSVKDDSGAPLINSILDSAGQKGTGKWTGQTALDLGVPLTLITEAVFARSISAMVDERKNLADLYPRSAPVKILETGPFLGRLAKAVFAAKVVSYAQGFDLMRRASEEFGWGIDLAGVARLWRGGCIIRSSFLDRIASALDSEPDLSSLLAAPWFRERIAAALYDWRAVVETAVREGVAVPAISSALVYFEGMTTLRLPANLVQAQRDYFGAHLYERVDRPRGEFFHTDWTGRGGGTASSAYSA